MSHGAGLNAISSPGTVSQVAGLKRLNPNMRGPGGGRGDAGGVPVPRGSRRGPAAPRGRRTKSNRLQTMRGAALMDRSADQWDGRTGGRPRGTANGRLQEAGLRGPTFINERVCVYGAETARVVTLMSVPHPGSSSIGGVGLVGLSPQSLEGLGYRLGPRAGAHRWPPHRRVGARPLPTMLVGV